MISRRVFFSKLVFGIPAAVAQQAIMQNGKAIVCEGEAVTCPACKQKTCKVIDAPIVVGNDLRQNPDVAQLFDYHILRCDNPNCHAAFFRE